MFRLATCEFIESSKHHLLPTHSRMIIESDGLRELQKMKQAIQVSFQESEKYEAIWIIEVTAPCPQNNSAEADILAKTVCNTQIFQYNGFQYRRYPIISIGKLLSGDGYNEPPSKGSQLNLLVWSQSQPAVSIAKLLPAMRKISCFTVSSRPIVR